MKIYTASGDSCEYCHIIGKDYLGNIYRTAGFTVNVQNAVGVPNLTNEQNITISPNPFSSQTTITFSSEQKNSTIKVVNVLGETIQQLTTNASTSSATGQQQLTLDMSNVAKGMYFVEINFDGTSASSITQQRSVVKVVKE